MRRILVWGEASRRHAVTQHGFAEAEVAVTGPPHMDLYGLAASSVPAYTPPNLPRGQRPLVAVIGTTLAYWQSERDMLAELSRLVGRGDLPCDLWYRHHPRARDRSDPKLPGVVFDPPRPEQVALPHLRWVLSRAVAVVAAFSTVCVEAALLGTPSLLIGFGASTGGTEYGDGRGRLVSHAKYEHMREVLALPGITLHTSLDDLVARLGRLVREQEIVDPIALAAAARRIAEVGDGGAQARIVHAVLGATHAR